MDPFADPPSTQPVSLDPPTGPPSRRGRRWFGAMAAVGLVGVGVGAVAAGQLGSDGPDSAAAIGLPGGTVDEPTDDATADDETADDETADDGGVTDDQTADDTTDHGGPGDGEPGEGEPGEGDDTPVIIDLDGLDDEVLREVQECLGIDVLPPLDGAWLDGLDEWLEELPELDIDGHGLDELPGGPFDTGTHVTVFGPDGATVVELGDGDGEVTISRRDGELTIETDGDATATDLDEVIGELPEMFEPGDGAPSFPGLDELLGGLPSPDEMAACLDQ